MSRGALALFAAGAIAIIAGFALTSPIPQDPIYHLFADERTLLGVVNALNVLSNLPFLIVGTWGLVYVVRHRPVTGDMTVAYTVFFLGVFLTGVGSGYYHLAPANGTLVWDRVPMAISFAGLFSVVVGEFMSAHVGRRLLLPLLVISVGSVAYWAITEARDVGDLRPYAVVQFLPMLLTPLILALRGRGKPLTPYFWALIFFYVLAKVAEFYDTSLYAAFPAVSGHSLKHLLASLSPAAVLVGLASAARIRESGRTPD